MTNGREESRKTTITVSSGTGTGLITRSWDLSRWIRIIPPNESSVYTFSIKDGGGNLILSRTAQLGSWAERVEISLGIAASIVITDATPDGTYTAIFDLH